MKEWKQLHELSRIMEKTANGVWKWMDGASEQVDVAVLKSESETWKEELFRVLRHTFVPPVDREDMAALASAIHRLTVQIGDAALHIAVYPEACPKLLGLCGLLAQNASIFHTSVVQWKLYQPVQTEKLYAESIQNIAAYRRRGTQSRSLACMELLHLLHMVKHCLDGCESLFDLLKTVILKNS